MPPIKVLFLKMIGCKIGKNVVLSKDEWIFDPYVTEIGDNTTIGGRSNFNRSYWRKSIYH